jgi:hypothetical protein
MRRYLITAVVAEVIGIIALFLALKFWGEWPSRAIFYEATSGFSTPEGVRNMDRRTEDEVFRLDEQGRQLADQLDLLDGCIPFVVGFPAIAVLSLWTFDRRRRQKQQRP